ncbi:MAG: tetraacyldisaccharide 4'-kinase [Myxococcaceae bacterium]
MDCRIPSEGQVTLLRRLPYIVASYVAFWVAAPFLLLHPKTRPGLRQRLGFFRVGELPVRDGVRVWFHGASAGDLLALAPMIEGLRAARPDVVITVSTLTNTGRWMAEKRLASFVDAIVYAPYDLWGATRRAMRAARPALVVLEYAELWPNWVFAAREVGAQLVLTNGRLSPHRVRGYRWLFLLCGNLLKEFARLLMRDAEEAGRARELGAHPEAVLATGNTKFDALVPQIPAIDEVALRTALRLDVSRPVLMAGSTHEGEESLLLEAFRQLRVAHPTLQLLLAPRYVDRATRVENLAVSLGFRVCRRSGAGNAVAHPDVVVLDTIGELSRAYRLASLVFVGGSFTHRGGQNVLEPAAQGRPVLFGPHMENFRDSVQVLLGRGGVQVKDIEQLVRVAGELLARPEQAQGLGEMAQAAVRQVSGASARNVDVLLSVLALASGMSGSHRQVVPKGWGSRLEAYWFPKHPAPAWTRVVSIVFGWLMFPYQLSFWWRMRRWHRGARGAKIPRARVVSVGSLYVGGAGKTPVVIALAQRAAAAGQRVAVVTRGYGRRSHQPILLRVGETVPDAAHAGDEPLLILRRCPGVVVAVGPRRDVLAKRVCEEDGVTLILLDDGFQQQDVSPDENWVVLDGRVGLGNGELLPLGPLREPKEALARASVLWLQGVDQTARQLTPPAWNGPVVRAEHVVRWVEEANGALAVATSLAGKRVIAFCGIARPSRFFETVAMAGCRVHSQHAFPDHHAFSAGELGRLEETAAQEGALLLTTEKDKVRLPSGFPAAALRLDVEVTSGETILRSRLGC